jgi:hypothetical protein
MMAEFKFVTLTHPKTIKDKVTQNAIRTHAIRTSMRKARDKAQSKNENFRPFSTKLKAPHRKRNQTDHLSETLPQSPTLSWLLDPFDTLPISKCSVRLQQLLSQSKA